MGETNEEAIKVILDNFRTQIEEDLKDEQKMNEPDQEIIDQYEASLTKLQTIDQYKLLQHTLDYICEEIDL